jgi:mono/diheme cytochrome c family protein
VLFLALALSLSAQEKAPAPVDFEREIRPLLSDTCYTCHGPDGSKRKAKLRLDSREGAFAAREGTRTIVPGKPDESELYRRLVAADEEDRMPPKKSQRPLSAAQIQRVRRWIEEGAPWSAHWSFVAPKAPALPETKNRAWRRNPIDDFVLARLEKEGIAPSPEADRATLLRRVSLDLTGIPPSTEELDAFLSDPAADAYERAVDRLLASPRYGERMAVRWLDAARYADTSGYQNDGPRDMWRWRDWVLAAFNANMPFDRFTVEQLAGDLLPAATVDQRIATGFNRNHRGNSEGGIIPEEYQVEYVVDRVDTTATVWLGLTAGCARCHDHKYDPITQEEFYRLFAYFNNIPEHGRAIKVGNSPPFVQAPTEAQLRQRRALDADLEEARRLVESLQPALARAQAEWEKTLKPDAFLRWTVSDGLAARFDLDGDASGLKVSGAAPEFIAGRVDGAARFDGRGHFEAPLVGKFGFFDKFSLAAWVRDGSGTILSRMDEAGREAGYHVNLEHGRVQVNLVMRWLDDAIRVETERALDPGWHHVAVTYDGSRAAAGVAVYVDGRPERLKVHLDFLNQTFATEHPFRIGAGRDPFRGEIDDVRVYGRRLSPEEVTWIATARFHRSDRRPSGRAAHAGPGGQGDGVLPRSGRARARPRGPSEPGLADPPQAGVRGKPADRDGHGGADDAPSDSRAPPRGVQPARQARRPRRPRRAASAGRRRAAQPSGARPLARRSRQPPDGARRREPLVADVLRLGHRPHGRGLWSPGRAAQPPGTARLAGRGLRPRRLGRQALPEDRRHERDLTGSRPGSRRACWSGTPTIACSRAAPASGCPPKSSATRRWRPAGCWWSRWAGRR